LQTKKVVFADLDGTFLDDNYGCQHTKPIVNQLSALGCSVVFCSSKTKSEIEFYRQTAQLNEPFIAENGAAIYIPKKYFPFNYACTKTAQYNTIRIGAPYAFLRDKLGQIRQKTAATIVGFGDMTHEEVAMDARLPLPLAKLAKRREHDEPFRIIEGSRKSVMGAIKDSGLHCTVGGRYFHLTGKNDKGKAVAVLKGLYNHMFAKTVTFGIGDGPNDLPMLKVVDKPFFIRKSHNSSAHLDAWRGILQLIV
jgi:mannosyl-3-phosphoglycerate phosphatase